MKYSELTLTDKLNEARNLVLDFSKNVIPDIDKKINERKPKQIEAPYYDLIVESFFSIQSFCILTKEGLISSASAIERIILEQVSISFLLSKNPEAKERFLQIKQDMVPYFIANKENKKNKECEIREKYKLGKVNLNNFSDYGWCITLGCKSMNLESICEKAGTSQIYETVKVFLHGFAHGQRSIHQFYRRRNGVDSIFITNLHLDLFQLFYKLLDTTVTEFGDDVISKENDDRFKMVESLVFDIKARLTENMFKQSLAKKDLRDFDARKFYVVFASIAELLNEYQDPREKYLLSQAYMRLAKLIIATVIIRGNDKLLVEKSDALCMSKLFKAYKPDISKLDSNISIDNLLEIMDRVDDDWSFNDDNIDYITAYCINDLIETLLEKSNYETSSNEN